jgi:hypothetical protein
LIRKNDPYSTIDSNALGDVIEPCCHDLAITVGDSDTADPKNFAVVVR